MPNITNNYIDFSVDVSMPEALETSSPLWRMWRDHNHVVTMSLCWWCHISWDILYTIKNNTKVYFWWFTFCGLRTKDLSRLLWYPGLTTISGKTFVFWFLNSLVRKYVLVLHIMREKSQMFLFYLDLSFLHKCKFRKSIWFLILLIIKV